MTNNHPPDDDTAEPADQDTALDESDPRALAERYAPRNGTTAGRNATHRGGTGSASSADALRRYDEAPASAKRGHR